MIVNIRSDDEKWASYIGSSVKVKVGQTEIQILKSESGDLNIATYGRLIIIPLTANRIEIKEEQ